ncbi:MAG: D-alanyl-D-alanine carboxypeptidase family protein [Arthrobacter sp.]|uniref:D-alanyl-D-alanine carboxypeptidase family protein n=1 Tax=Arthrobacter sp. TaxID=1667 RepID=UPI00347CF620
MSLSLGAGLALGAAAPASAAPSVSPAAAAGLAPASWSAGTLPLLVAVPAAPPRNPASAGVLVNRQHPLAPKTYVPRLQRVAGTPVYLQPTGAGAYAKMAAASRKAGVTLRATSSYRSYAAQRTLLANYTRWYGAAYANRVVAPPGTSEHQTGLAVDVSTAGGAGAWLARNAYRYGFILRYPRGQEWVTGYAYEPWHFRYVGTAIASAMKSRGTPTLEHHYGVARGTTATTTANLNLRVAASTTQRVLRVIPRGARVALTGKSSGSWHQVKYGWATGWVSGEYLR